MEISKQVFDNLQFNLQQALDDIIRLKARVTALEAGAPLPADQSVAPIIEAPPPSGVGRFDYVEPTDAEIVATIQPESETTALPDISQGWVGGGRRH